MSFTKILKKHIQKDIFRGVEGVFLAKNVNRFIMHPFVKINPKKDFLIIADSDKGAEIIQWNETVL